MHSECHPPLHSLSIGQSSLPYLSRDVAPPFKPVHPSSPLNTSRPLITKRVRSSRDVDGENTAQMQKKKRRLRVELITSRLSKPFATPSTYILGRSGLKIAVWARPKIMGTNLLRKAAILNSMRKKGLPARRRVTEQLKTIQAFDAGENPDLECITEQAGDGPSRTVDTNQEKEESLQTKVSTVGVSNYDAFDEEGDPYDEDSQDEGDSGLIYSNFNDHHSGESLIDDYDCLEPATFLSRSCLVARHSSEFASERRKVASA